MTQENNLVLKLNTGAMNALFPEGSPARVDLQQAVIQNFFERALKVKLGESISTRIAQVERQAKEHMDAALNEHLGMKKSGYYGAWEFSTTAKTEMSKLVKQAAATAISEAVAESTVEIKASVKARIENLDINTLIKKLVTEEATAAIRKKLLEKLA